MKNATDQALIQLELQLHHTRRRIQKLQQEVEDRMTWDGQSEFLRLQEQLARLELAQQRRDKGLFGTCLLCRMPIQPERLVLVPWAEVCMSCHQKAVKNHAAGLRSSTPAYI